MKRKPDFKNGIFHGKPIYVLAVILLTVLLVISILTAVTIGSVDLSVKDVYSVILYKVFGIGDPEVYGVGAMSDIVWFIRLPRILLATAVGMGLAVAGVVMQAIVKNRLQIRIFLVFPLVHLLVQQWQSFLELEPYLAPTLLESAHLSEPSLFLYWYRSLQI